MHESLESKQKSVLCAVLGNVIAWELEVINSLHYLSVGVQKTEFLSPLPEDYQFF